MANRRRSRKAGPARPRTPERSTRHHEKPQVLVVEHDQGSRLLLEGVLEDAGYRVMLADGAEEALVALACQRPALMTVDLTSPRVDGWTILESLAGSPWRPPVVAISAHRQGDRVRALGRSDVRYLDKPYRIDELLGLCRSLLNPPHDVSFPT